MTTTPLQIESWPLDQLRPAPYNPRRITDTQLALLQRGLVEYGMVQPVIANRRTGYIVGGHQRAEAARRLKWATVPVVWVDLDDAHEKALNIALNKISGTFDVPQLADLLQELDTGALDMDLTGHTEDELEALFTSLGGDDDPAAADEAEAADDAAGEPPADPITRPGDLIVLGRHRLICGDSTDRATVARLLQGVKPDVILTDPPYCSGGFQEAGKKSGSIGTRGTATIANDNLSTRGYQALIAQVLRNVDAGVAYVFTDWRMWVALFDVVESSGYGVRNMLVWDKQTPGMGVGWRHQHELAMCAVKVKSPFNPHKAQGNVLQAKRTGNKHHPTEKPLDLLETILNVTDLAKTVVDPFSGSGTTILAAEKAGRTAYGLELEPAYCDVIVQRWEALTGKQAVRHGQTE